MKELFTIALDHQNLLLHFAMALTEVGAARAYRRLGHPGMSRLHTVMAVIYTLIGWGG